MTERALLNWSLILLGMGSVPVPCALAASEWESRPLLSARDYWAATASSQGRLVLGHRLALFIPQEGPVHATYFLEETGFRGVAHGNGQFVAVGYYGSVWSSPDGRQWTKRTINGTNNLFSVTYAFNEFMAVGGYGGLFYSADGAQWELMSALGVSTLFDVVKGPDHVITVGKLGQIVTSSDGRGWTYHLFGEDGTFHNIAWGNGRYLTFTWEGVGRVSADAQTWERIDVPMGLKTLAGSDQGFFATDEAGALHYTPDGHWWFHTTLPFTNRVNRLSSAQGELLAACDQDLLLATTSGFHWQAVKTQLPAWTAWAATPTHQLALGSPGLLAHSTDGGATWWPRQSHLAGFNSLLARGQVFWATAPGGGLWTSTDATNWVARATGVTNDLRDLTFAGLTGVAVGSAGGVLHSFDGTIWNAVASGTTRDLRAVATAGGPFVAVGEGVVCHSVNGDAWGCQPLPGGFSARDVAVARGIWIVAGDGGALARSLDGLQWHAVPLNVTNNLRQVATGNGSFLVAGAGGLVLRSADGLEWTGEVLPDRAEGGAWHFADRRFQALGDSNLRWQSGDVRVPRLKLAPVPGQAPLQVRLSGELGHTYRLQRSGSPAGPWDQGQPVSLSAPNITILESAPAPDQRFYRAVTP